ncbi:MAG: aminotransferase [Rickettsiales bacterium]|nr:aminotransferase [Rickettsiales bacterium]
MKSFRSRRTKGLVQSDIRYMSRECNKVGGINLGQGICDMPTPDIVREAAIAAIREGSNIYSYAEGALELRDAIANKLARYNGLEVDPQRELVISVGASGAFSATINALLDVGDGIVLFEPYYGYHLHASEIAGLKPSFVSLQAPHFRFTEEQLTAAIRPETRAIVVCTPSNPCGKMFNRKELEIIATVANRHDLLVITDEVYEYIVFDGRRHISPASLPELRERCISITSLSKTFAITGWRLGYVVAPEAMAHAIMLVSDLLYICAPTPLQHGVAAGFSAPDSYFESLRTDYQDARDMLCEALQRASMEPIVPQGAYYLLADVERMGEANARDAAMTLLARTGVAAVSGHCFYRGDGGQQLLRFCFAKERSALEEACRRLAAFRP